MLRRFAAIALLTACAAPEVSSTTQPVVNGTLDDRDEAVVAIVDSSGMLVCTGTLIAPHVVLTAAHCDVRARWHRVIFGSDVKTGASLEVSDATKHPSFSLPTLRDDLQLLTVRGAITALPVARATSVTTGAEVRLVGFGATGAGLSDGRKREGTSAIESVAEKTFRLASLPSQPCRGDSGGPAFVDDRITGVTSKGDEACREGATDTRVDAYAEFIDGYLARVAPGSARAGQRCLYDEQCAEGSCVAAVDEPAIHYCSTTCGSCAAPLTCAAGQCRHPLPTPGALGSRCGADADCVDAECASGVCTRRCDPITLVCPTDFTCKNTTGVRFDCVRNPAVVTRAGGGGSCAMHGASRGHGSLGVWPALLLFLVGSRRRRSGRVGLRRAASV